MENVPEAERNKKGQFVGDGPFADPEFARRAQAKGARKRKQYNTDRERLFAEAGHKPDGSNAPQWFRTLVDNMVKDGNKWAFDKYQKYIGQGKEHSGWEGKGECPTCGRGPSLLDDLDVDGAEALLEWVDSEEERNKAALATVNQLRGEHGMSMISLSDFQYGRYEDYLPASVA